MRGADNYNKEVRCLMGTNYYWIKRADGADEDSIEAHIGKTSSAGAACDECGVAKRTHSDFMHYGAQGPYPRQHGNTCPMCDKPWTGRAMSFIWTAFSHRWRLEALCRDGDETPTVVNEYGVTMCAAEVLAHMPPVTIHRLSSTEFC